MLIDDYTSLITSQHAKATKFVATVDLTANAIRDIRDVAVSLQTLFDVDDATGEALDFIGEWVGCPRRLDVPLDVFFSWDTSGLGWNQGYWKGQFVDGAQVVYLDDETYRLVMKTVIKANHWDGSLWDYQDVMQTAFPNNVFIATDNQDMTMSITLTGPPLSDVMSAVLQSGQLSRIKPSGVAISSYTLP